MCLRRSGEDELRPREGPQRRPYPHRCQPPCLPPELRLSSTDGRAVIKVRTGRMVSTASKGAASDPIRFLILILWTWREMKQRRIALEDLRRVWKRLRVNKETAVALNLVIPMQMDSVRRKAVEWMKKINKDRDIRQIQFALLDGEDAHAAARNGPPAIPFIQSTVKSQIGSEMEIWFSCLPLDEVDWDDTLYPYVRFDGPRLPNTS